MFIKTFQGAITALLSSYESQLFQAFIGKGSQVTPNIVLAVQPKVHSGTGCDPTPTRSLTPTPTPKPNPHPAVQHWTTYLTHLSGLIHTDLSPSLNFWFNSVQAGGAESGSGSSPTHRLLVLQHCRICSSQRICSYSVYTVYCVLQRTLNSASYKAEWQVVSSILLLVEDALYVGEAY